MTEGNFSFAAAASVAALLICVSLAVGDEKPVPNTPVSAHSIPEQQLEPLLNQLRSRFYRERFDAMDALKEMGKPAADALRPGLYDKDVRYRINCIDTLLFLGDKSILPDLYKIAFEEKHARLRTTALRAIEWLDPFGLETAKIKDRPVPAERVEFARTKIEAGLSATLYSDIEEHIVPQMRFYNSAHLIPARRQPELQILFDEIAQLSSLGKIQDALRACQKTIELRLSNPTESAEDPTVYTAYLPVLIPVVRETIEKNLTLYRQMFDKKAQDAFQQCTRTMRPADVAVFVRKYLFTTYGRKALELLLHIEHERTNYRQVIWMWKRYGKIIKDLSPDTEAIIMASYCRSAARARAQQFMDEIVSRNAADKIIVEGKTVELERFARNEFDNIPNEPPGSHRLSDSSTYSSPFPSETKIDRYDFGKPIILKSIRRMHRLIRVMAFQHLLTNEYVYFRDNEIPMNYKEKEEFLRKNSLSDRSFGQAYVENGSPPYQEYPYHPVVAGDRVVINNGRDVVCLSASTGKEMWRHTTPIDGFVKLKNRLPFKRCAKFPLACIVEEENAVFALLESTRAYNTAREIVAGGKRPKKIIPSGSTLVCLDLDTGKVRWTADEKNDFLYGAFIYSLPHCRGGTLYSTVIPPSTGKSLRHFYFVAIDITSGLLKWKATLSAFPGRIEADFYRKPLVSATPEIYENTAFVLTNYGTLASIRTDDGTLNWLALYHQSAPGNPEQYFKVPDPVFGDTKVRVSTPPVLWGGTVFAMPNDSDNFFAFDATTGKLLWKVPAVRKDTEGLMRESQRFTQFLIDHDGTSYLLGAGAMAIDHKGNILWDTGDIGSSIGVTLLDRKWNMKARGALLDSRLVLPGKDGLLLINKKSGRIDRYIDLKLSEHVTSYIRKLIKTAATAPDAPEGKAAREELIRIGAGVNKFVREIEIEIQDEELKKKYTKLSQYLSRELRDTNPGLDIGRQGMTGNIMITDTAMLICTKEGLLIVFRLK